MKTRWMTVVSTIAIFSLTVGGAADPVSAAEHQRLWLAESTLQEALDASAAGTISKTLPVVAEPAPVEVATGSIEPGEPTELDIEEVGATVEFSGFEIEENLDVTVSELSGQATAAAEAELGAVAVSTPFDVSAETASGDDVSEFPVDAVIEEAPDGTPVVTEVTPGVAIEVEVDAADVADLDPSSLRIVTREAAGDPWVEIPSYYDEASGSVKGEIDHLSQFVVIGTPFVPPPGPRIVLDPDDDVGNTIGPGGPMTELPQNVRLANELAERMTEGCLADVLVTRTVAAPPFVSTATRAGMAAAHAPDLTITLAFNANVGFPWGVEGDGGSIAFSRGGGADNALQASLVAQLPGYTGRPANGSGSASYPYTAFDGLPGAMAHLETLFIDHNYDRPVIDNGFEFITSGVFTGIGVFLETQGFDCTDPVTGGWPARPSEADLAKWRNLGYQNYLTYGADPVSFSTGNLVEDEPIFTLTGVGGQQLDLTLVYNSQDGRLTRTGAGWNFGLTSHAQRFDDGSVLVVRGDGASFVFEPNGTGGYTTEEGLYLTLTENGDGTLLLTAVDGESWVYDAADIEGIGELAVHTDRQGNSYALSYATPDDNDQFVPLASITDEAGQVVTIGHDDLGRISSFTHPDGRAWTLSYDAAGDLISITNPDSRVRSFTYDAAHQMLSATDAAGITYLVNEYDTSGRVVKQWDADNNLRTFDYDLEPGVGGETTYVDNEGVETVFRFDERSRITEIEDAAGGTKQYTYDDGNQVVAFTDERGQTWEYDYDDRGNVATETMPDGTAVHYTYTPTGEVASITDEGGLSGARTVSFDVDAQGLTTGVTRSDGAEIVNVFDGHGDLTATTDAAGGTTSFGYDARGNLVSSTDPLGRVTTFSYDNANRLTTAIDPAGGVTSFVWDAGDRLVSQTDPAGGVTSFSYDANDHPLTRTDPDGGVTAYEWDELFRLVKTTDPEGAVTSFEYNTEDELVKVTDALGRVNEFTLDVLYRPVTITDPDGQEWDRAYDPAGNVLTATDPLGAVTAYEYDELGRLAEVTDALGGTTTNAFDEVGRLVAQTDALGQTTSYAYDVLDRLVESLDQAGESAQYGYDLLGNLTTAVDRRGHTTSYSYDAVSQLTSWSGPVGTGGSYTYDSRGNQLTATDALGRETSYGYDALNRPVSVTDPAGAASTVSYDPVGRIVAATDANGHTTEYDYDLAGRLTEMIDPLGNATGYTYDLAGQRTGMTDAAGVETRYGYDGLGRLTAVTEGFVPAPVPTGPDVNVTTSYAYSPVGNVESITDPKGAVTSFVYDLLGRTTQETNPLGKTWDYAYDALSRVTSEVDGKNQTTTYSYTPRSEVSLIHYGDGTETGFEYDAEQNLIVMTDELGASGWVYDAAARVTEATDSLGQSIGYGYDAASQRTDLELPTGDVEYEFDDVGRPVLESSPWGSVGYAYDPAGNLTDVLRSTGVTSEYGYDAADRLTDLTHTSPGSELGCDLGANDIEVGADIQTLIDLELCLTIDLDIPVLTGLDYGDSIELDYGYDEVGNVTSQTRKDGSAGAVTTSYGYDALHRLTSSATTAGSTNGYSYDKAGNRTKWVTNDAPETGAALTVNASYNAAGQLTAEAKTRPGLLGIPSTATTNYTYDDNGNRTREQTGAAVTTLSYTADDRLAEVDQGVREVSYEYDGLGRSLTETVDSLLILSETTTRLWDGLQVVGMDSSAFGDTTLVRDPFGGVSIQASDALLGTDVRWGLTDLLGSSIGQAQGSKIGQLAEYSDWGKPTFNSLGWNSETGFTGELGDTTSGLVNFYARSYDPAAATWLSADPYRGVMSDPQTLSRYQYVGSNPATEVDLFGFMSARASAALQARYEGQAKSRLMASLARQEAAMVNRLDPTGSKQKAAEAKSPSGASEPAARHGEMETLLAVLDGISMIAGFAAFIPGPQQPVFLAIAGIAGAAATFMRCMTGGVLSPDCLIDVVFSLLGPIGKGLKHVIGPVVKQALGGAVAVVNRAPTSAAATKVDDAASCVVGGLKSFSGDTEVLLADGTSKPIEEIEVGDEVLAADPETGEQAGEEVTHLWVHEDELIDLGTNAGTVTTTEDHPFWNDTDQQWQGAEDLDAGDALLTADGNTITVVGLDEGSVQDGLAYNLTVDRLHTYYVKIADIPVLVHNTCGQIPHGPVPQNASETADFVRANGAPPAGVRGGSTFANDGRSGGTVLPRQDASGAPITYREWDVNQNTPGTNRGGERLVTGSDGSTYYTSDHYGTFTRFG